MSGFLWLRITWVFHTSVYFVRGKKTKSVVIADFIKFFF